MKRKLPKHKQTDRQENLERKKERKEERKKERDLDQLGSGHIDTIIWMNYMDSNKTDGEEARRQLHKNVASNLEQVPAATPHKTPTIRPAASYHENYSS